MVDSGMACLHRSAFAIAWLGLACGGGSSDEGDTSSATTPNETGGSTAQDDDDDDDDDDGSTAAPESSGGSSAVTEADSGTGGGAPCQSNDDCGDDERCDFADESCGASGVAGSCTPRPSGCDNEPRPVCGCDNELYDSVCDAAAAGTDVAFLANCEVPTGAFACGYSFCILDMEYCAIEGGASPSASCIELPPVCMPPNCNCLSDCCDCDTTDCCANLCTNENGALTFVCPG